MTIKAIIFDIDGVVILQSKKETYLKIIRTFKISSGKFKEVRAKYVRAEVLGRLSSKEYFRRVAQDLKIKDYKILGHIWKNSLDNTLKMDKDMRKLIIRLKNNYRLGSMTNVSYLDEKSRQKNKVYRYFEITLKSCNLSMEKPEPRIYKLLLKKLKLPAEEILFIDDSKENILTAKKLGIKTIWCRSNSQLIRDLKKLRIKI